jgi:predicted transcriptional regulator
MPKVRRTRRTKPHKKSAKAVPITTQALVQAVRAAPVVPPSNGAAVPASGSPSHLPADEHTRLPADSLVRKKAMHILAMRMAGNTNQEIAKALDIAERSIRQYIYLAGRNGWLVESENWADPADRLEFELSHKVIRNLDEAMDDDARNEKTGMKVKTAVALKVAEGTIFKKFSEAVVQPNHSNILAIRIETLVGTAVEVVREGAGGGTPRFTEGEIIDVPSDSAN